MFLVDAAVDSIVSMSGEADFIGMAPSLKQLRAMSDEEVEEAHDALAKRTVVGVSYFLDEASRRAFERASAAALEEARAARKLAIANAFVAIVAVLVAVAAIVVQALTAG